MREVCVVTLVCLCVGAVWSQDPPVTTVDPTDIPGQTRKVVVPPLIVTEPAQNMAFREEESIEMPCRATGEPEPTYYWHFNNEYFDPSGNDGRIAIQPGVGTLIFARPIRRDEGIYQCFASNLGGVSASVKVALRWAFLEPFQSTSVVTHRPQVGHPQTLKCVQPRSFPKPEVFWATVAQGETFSPIDLTDRVTIDPETGSLHLANVLREDAKGGRKYACVVQNKVVRSFQQGDYQIIEPLGDISQTMAPGIMWQSPTHQVALRDDQWRVKCIFSGRPTPRVDWARLDGNAMPNRARQESFGQELVIEKVQMGDAGQYECQGINDATQVPTRRSFSLKVEASPYWKNKPESKNAAEFDTAVYHCEAYGFPEPTYEWFINGEPVSKIASDPRRIVQKNSMTFMNLSRADVQVIQCNATNKNGYIFANAYLNVLTEPPTITEPPLTGQKAAEGQTINLTCLVFGSPKPLVIWRKGSEQLTGGRFKIMPEGHLQITDVSLVDAGTYTCTAQNRLGEVQKTGSLIVRRKTLIQTIPLDVTVYEGTEAKFTCTATTDPEEVQNLEIRWKKDGDFIDYRVAQRMFKNIMDNSLSVSGTIAQDTAKYTCVAVNGLDSDEASAQLTVQGSPDPPSAVNVEWFEKNKREVKLSWQPSKENYAPILNFIIQFNTTFNPDTWIDLASNLSQNQRQGEFILSPYGNYTFRALARNKVGMSPPSDHTRPSISTEPAPPDKNPDNVIGEGDQPNNLIIYWTPMPLLEQNADSFYYLISWKRTDASGNPQTHRVDDALQYKFVVFGNHETYKPYEISVKAANAQGDATVQPDVVIGYSGENTPLDAPADVLVIAESIRDTEADVSWSQVQVTPDRVRGFFRGYRITFWKTSDPTNRREQDVIIREPKYYRPPRSKRSLPRTVVVKLQNLTPFTEIAFIVQVLNKYYVGPSSPEIKLTTKEGKPGPPAQFNVKARGSTHFDMMWTKPREENGHLIGYNISYQSITGLNLGRLQYRQPITDPNQLQAQLTGLQPQRNYRVFLAAVTQAGQGEPIFLDMRTTVPGPPSKPTFAIMDIWETAVNISWEPARTGNPGSVFYAQYRPRGMYHWENTADESNKYWKYVENLWPGTVYQARVVAKNGAGEESGTEYQDFRTRGVPPGSPIVETSPWFYGMILALFLIIGLVIAFFIFKRFTDKQWDTKESEREEQIRTLQAQIATEQMGFVNQYADTGSRTDFMESSYGSELKKPPVDSEYHSDEDVFPSSYPPAQTKYPGYGAQQPTEYPAGSHMQPGVYAEPPVEDQYAPPPAGAYGYSPPPDQSQLGYRPPAAQSSPQPGVHRPLSGSPATGGLTGAGLAGSPAMMGLPPGVQVQDGQYVMQQPGAPKDAMSTFV